ncbi:MAG: hypothetical protein ACYTBY_10705 [Planctomycetota bacterium]
MADANKKPKPEKQFWTVPRSKNNATPNKKPKPEKKHEPAKAPLCHHHNGDCEADIPEHVLQSVGVPRGLYCETEYERGLREEEEICRYAEYYHPE